MKHTQRKYYALNDNRKSFVRRGFTLMQLLLVMAMVAILSAMFLGAFGKSRESARRAQCDVRLKTVSMALDAFRQETGSYPEDLTQLISKKYLTETEAISCPSDPRPNGSFNDYYVLRAGRDGGELPILVCPLCADESNVGLQAFKGRYTKQFATRPAQITEASGASVERPGKNPINARVGMELRGGDIIRTVDGGSATVRFADGSTGALSGGTEITVLQSFIAGNSHAPLYTLISQKAGQAAYVVHHGSKFDVSTPTATAGALGTAFEIREDGDSKWWLKVTESKVLVSDLGGSDIVSPRPVAPGSDDDQMKSVATTVTDDWTFIGQTESAGSPADGDSTSDADNSTTKKKKDKKIKKKRNRWKNSNSDD